MNRHPIIAERKIMRILTCSLLVTAILAWSFSAVAAERRMWTSADGKFTVDAELVEQQGDSIRLKKADGSVISVPVAKISQADREYLKRSDGDRFVLPKILSIASPPGEFKWSVARQMETNGLKATILACAKDGSDSRIVLVIEHRRASNDAQKIAAVKGHYNGLLDSLQQLGLQIEKAVQAKLDPPIPKKVDYSFSGRGADRKPLEVRGSTVFGERIYSFQILSRDPSEAEQLAITCDTLQEMTTSEHQ
jgi:hypothetical protein